MRATVLLILAACGGDDGGGKAIDAAKPNDGKLADARLTDGPPPDAPTKVRTVDCTQVLPSATVSAEDGVFAFMPAAVTITANQSGEFTMPATHNVVPGAAPSDPGLRVPFSGDLCLQFTETGTYNFKCGPHGFTGSVTVNP